MKVIVKKEKASLPKLDVGDVLRIEHKDEGVHYFLVSHTHTVKSGDSYWLHNLNGEMEDTDVFSTLEELTKVIQDEFILVEFEVFPKDKFNLCIVNKEIKYI